ncbi:MAG: cardiolipin synthase [Xanthomonadales bacterium]|nr:cardiolipin synthase [Xanthomonadales bacterium]
MATAFYIAGIVAAIDAVMSTRTSQGAIAWAVSLVTFPFVAVPAYLVFGRRRFEGASHAFKTRRAEIEELIGEVRDRLQPWLVVHHDEPGWHLAVSRLAERGLTRGNQVELLINGDATFDSIFAGIARAKDYVLFHFYMIHDDGLGRRAQQALIERARAGVRVHVLYDEVGSKGLSTPYIRELEKAGVQVTAFKPTQGFRNRFQLNFRNHRKIVVVDGRVGWVGGHNVGDEYLGLDPDLSPWRDTHLRIEGPAVQQLQIVAVTDWYWATRTLPRLEWSPLASPDGDRQVMILPSGPVGPFETASLYFVAALNAATERVWLSAPYFVPDEAVMKSLKLAALRGVDVRILTTGKGDSLPVQLAGHYFMQELRGLDIAFYAFTPGFLHEKALLIDDRVSVVGTHNFDNRSFRLNFEVAALVDDSAFAEEMEAMFLRDFEHSEPIDLESFDTRGFWWHLGVRLARLAAPVL